MQNIPLVIITQKNCLAKRFHKKLKLLGYSSQSRVGRSPEPAFFCVPFLPGLRGSFASGQLVVLAPLIFTAGRARLDCFSKNHFKNRLFRLLCMLGIPRMAAKLRPAGRQTTPPGRAGIPHMQSKRNSTIFSQVFRESNSARPCHPPAARARNPEPWTRQMPIGKASELGGPNKNIHILFIKYLWIFRAKWLITKKTSA